MARDTEQNSIVGDLAKSARPGACPCGWPFPAKFGVEVGFPADAEKPLVLPQEAELWMICPKCGQRWVQRTGLDGIHQTLAA